MPKRTTRKDLIRRLCLLDFEGPYTGTKHAFMVRGDVRLRIPNPHGKDVSVSLLCEILRQAGIPTSEWDSL